MKPLTRALAGTLAAFGILLLLHWPLLRLPYFWDEAGYYIPAAFDFYRLGLLVPVSTQPVGHTPLVPVYLGTVWHLLGFSPLVTRSAMILIAAATLVATYVLARRFVGREAAVWVAVLLAVSPIFFAQSSLAHLDLTVTLFTTLAVLALIRERWAWFAVAASFAILSKETAVILLPIAWLFGWKQGRASDLRKWLWLSSPLLPLIVWAVYYHHSTGFWTGNSKYLEYNLYSALAPDRIIASFVRRVYETFASGFNWMPVAGAVVAAWWSKRSRRKTAPPEVPRQTKAAKAGKWTRLSLIAAWLTGVYIVFHSLVGGAVLPRYLLPIFPVLYLALVARIDGLPRAASRMILAMTAACFIAAWFINPPYPYPYEDNLAYAAFVRLQAKAGGFLEAEPGHPRILTAWPATDELSKPFLGYVSQPLRLVRVSGFGLQDFRGISPGSFDILFLYSRKWDPPGNWIRRIPVYRGTLERLFDYEPSASEQALEKTYGLHRVATFEERGQWVKIYSR
jgi:Dolichyl-phosphate-mannose-protein mannosyltransferase